jgi:hypothetical protein
MLEAGEVLQTWRLARAPQSGLAIDATALGDHRIAYLDYEGPVSGNRGAVTRWDAGGFDEQGDSLPEIRRLAMHGARVAGNVILEQVDGARWRFLWSS